jgi:predicted dehydrogenase
MRIAVVGTGGVARRHLGVLRAVDGVEVVGHLSADASRAAAQAAEWGGQPYSDLIRLLDETQPEAVWICVTPDRHGPLELALIERQIAFFVEKPLSVDLATAERINAAVASRLIAAVGYKFRALDTLPRVRELLRERPPRMVLAMWHDALPPPEWWRQSWRGGGQVVEQATHLLDLARLLVGEAEVVGAASGQWPRRDAPGSDVPDVSTALLHFAHPDGDVPGMLSASTLLRGHSRVELQLICEGRVLGLTERWLRVDDGRSVQDFATATDPFLVEDRVFVDAVRRQDPSGVFCTYADALETHRLAIAVRDAMRSATTAGRSAPAAT